ncbi:MAG: hypothetical protein U0Z75_03095 [Deinococcaceae bacterium]
MESAPKIVTVIPKVPKQTIMINISITSVEKPGEVQHLLMGTDVPRYYWEIQCHRDSHPQWSICIATNHHKIPPKFLQDDSGPVFVGAEQGVFSLDRQSGSVIDKVVDTTYVQDFVCTRHGPILVTSEDQLLAFAPTGHFLWRQNFPDCIENVQDKDTVLVVNDVAGNGYSIDIQTGRRHCSVCRRTSG